MCGVSGYIHKDLDCSNYLDSAIKIMDHRGPDQSGSFNILTPNNLFLGLGHNRLSILDLSEKGKQPMSLNDNIHISFNGEIYNYLEIKEKYLSGETFCSNTDTEVILKLYEKIGDDAFNELNGMFAFILFDKVENKVFYVRDRLGIKPLYFSKSNEYFIAASEIKGIFSFPFINKNISRDDIFEFFNQGFLYNENTGFLEVQKIPIGSYFELNLNDFKATEKKYKENLDEKNFEDDLKDVMNRQTRSDVPLGIFFSGGIDSSVIATSSKDTDLFFINYANGNDNEYKAAKKISAHLNKKMIIEESDNNNDVEELVNSIKFVALGTEELISDYTFFSTYKLSLKARESGFKVMLSGMGGDEIFTGYPRYRIMDLFNILKHFKYLVTLIIKIGIYPKNLQNRIIRLESFLYEKSKYLAYQRLIGYFSKRDLNDLFLDFSSLNKTYSKRIDVLKDKCINYSDDPIKLAKKMDIYGFLSHNLAVADKASMLTSLELRVPLLDNSLIHFSKIRDTGFLRYNSKRTLKLFLKKIFPTSFFNRNKVGFNPPMKVLVDNIGYKNFHEILSETPDFLNKNFIYSLLDDHFMKRFDRSYQIWQLTYFKFWYDSYNLE